MVERGGFRRLVLRSHAYAYGSNTKNPGLMTEDRVSLLPGSAPEQRWLRMEEIAAKHANAASVRLTNVLAPEEGDLVVQQVAGRKGISLAGYDPNVQFIGVEDAARALAAAVQSNATGIFNAAGEGTIPLRKVLRAAGARRSAKLLPRGAPQVWTERRPTAVQLDGLERARRSRVGLASATIYAGGSGGIRARQAGSPSGDAAAALRYVGAGRRLHSRVGLVVRVPAQHLLAHRA